ncbi:MAG: chemotaxis protein CheW [Prochloraceae cyanobacterium]
MNNDLINPLSEGSANSPEQKTGQSLKLVIFAIGSLNFALPVKLVKKVLNQTPIYGSGLNHIGVANIGDKEITVIDLHKRFFKSDLIRQSDSKIYLIVAQNSAGEEFGILVSQTPTLVDVPLSQIRTLPASYRRADTLDLASHVTIITQQTESLTVFLLDLDRVIPNFQ